MNREEWGSKSSIAIDKSQIFGVTNPAQAACIYSLKGPTATASIEMKGISEKTTPDHPRVAVAFARSHRKDDDTTGEKARRFNEEP